jgi:ketosteroid isomerase-like protein
MKREDTGRAAEPLVARFFSAMQTGATAEADMMALFAPDAVYVEPFSGAERTHRGRDAIRRAMREGRKRPLPEMRIEVESVNMEGDSLTARWICHSPALPGGSGRGENVFTLSDGLIVRLHTRFL